jgi:hypothetical protein
MDFFHSVFTQFFSSFFGGTVKEECQFRMKYICNVIIEILIVGQCLAITNKYNVQRQNYEISSDE